MTREESDAELIRRRLGETAGIGSNRKRARALGVSEGTVRIWLAAEASGESFPPLSDKVRERLRNVRATERVKPPRPEHIPYGLEREESELARIGGVDDPVLRILERESIAAVIRAQAVRESAWANRLAEQNTAARLRTVREVTAREDVGEPITDAETEREISRRRPREPRRAAGG